MPTKSKVEEMLASTATYRVERTKSTTDKGGHWEVTG